MVTAIIMAVIFAAALWVVSYSQELYKKKQNLFRVFSRAVPIPACVSTPGGFKLFFLSFYLHRDWSIIFTRLPFQVGRLR